jgi:hypothetical protein
VSCQDTITIAAAAAELNFRRKPFFLIKISKKTDAVTLCPLTPGNWTPAAIYGER